MHGTIDMKVKCNKAELIGILRENRTKHAQIVKEARAGYLVKAREAIRERLAALDAGKLVAAAVELPFKGAAAVKAAWTSERADVTGLVTVVKDDLTGKAPPAAK